MTCYIFICYVISYVERPLRMAGGNLSDVRFGITWVVSDEDQNGGSADESVVNLSSKYFDDCSRRI